MKSIKIILACSLIVLTTTLCAQTNLFVPREMQRAYDKGTRNLNGEPGENYWQNYATYKLSIRFEPTTRLITGSEEISYKNNSQDTIKEIVFKLFPNLYKKGSIRLVQIDPKDITDGVQFSNFIIDDKSLSIDKLEQNGTIMQVPVPSLLHDQTIHFKIEYSYSLNKGSHLRTGEVDEGAWFLAYFFPRIAVYDDINGWDLNPYIGIQEFYNDFCNFNFSITVPGDCIVWATGDLQNCSEVFLQEYCKRLSSAEKSDNVMSVIDTSDLKSRNITVNNKENTFRYIADNISDIAIGISNHYIWKSTSLVVDSISGRRTRVDAIFNSNHKNYNEIIDFARKTIETMSYKFPRWPYPYSHMTVFDGLGEMEYPMMANDHPMENRDMDIHLTLHEISHTMFPFYMGINETKYAWMDEGWATLSNHIIAPMIDSTIVTPGAFFDYYQKYAGIESDMPIITLSTKQNGLVLFLNSYPKPALGYLYTKDFLGDGLFYKGLHHYIRTWKGKHPTPLDFFNCMNNGTGVNLNWFWKSWFFENGVPDLAITKLIKSKKENIIVIERKGEKPVPIELTILYADKTKQKIYRSIGVWEHDNRIVEIKFANDKKVKEIILGGPNIPDFNLKDNQLTLD